MGEVDGLTNPCRCRRHSSSRHGPSLMPDDCGRLATWQLAAARFFLISSRSIQSVSRVGNSKHGDGAMDTGEFHLRELVAAIGGNRRPRETRADWLRRVAEAAGLHPRAVRGVWHSEPNISFETARRLKIAAEKRQNEQQHVI